MAQILCLDQLLECKPCDTDDIDVLFDAACSVFGELATIAVPVCLLNRIKATLVGTLMHIGISKTLGRDFHSVTRAAAAAQSNSMGNLAALGKKAARAHNVAKHHGSLSADDDEFKSVSRMSRQYSSFLQRRKGEAKIEEMFLTRMRGEWEVCDDCRSCAPCGDLVAGVWEMLPLQSLALHVFDDDDACLAGVSSQDDSVGISESARNSQVSIDADVRSSVDVIGADSQCFIRAGLDKAVSMMMQTGALASEEKFVEVLVQCGDSMLLGTWQGFCLREEMHLLQQFVRDSAATIAADVYLPWAKSFACVTFDDGLDDVSCEESDCEWSPPADVCNVQPVVEEHVLLNMILALDSDVQKRISKQCYGDVVSAHPHFADELGCTGDELVDRCMSYFSYRGCLRALDARVWNSLFWTVNALDVQVQ